MSNSSSQASPRLRQILIDLSIMTVVGVVLAILGPFGGSADPLALRLVVWLAFSYIGYAVYSPIDGLARRLAPKLDLPPWGLRVAGVLVASIPMSLAVWILPGLPDGPPALDLSNTLLLYFSVALIGGLITGLFTLIERAKGPVSATEAKASIASPVEQDGEIAQRPSFLERVPAELGSEILALEMEDHYVRVHTALGSDLVLMRMRDAVGELDGIEGMQVHRSWWVARGAVEDVVRDGRKLRLKLACGIEAPVSRANVSSLKDAGWV